MKKVNFLEMPRFKYTINSMLAALGCIDNSILQGVAYYMGFGEIEVNENNIECIFGNCSLKDLEHAFDKYSQHEQMYIWETNDIIRDNERHFQKLSKKRKIANRKLARKL